MRNKLFLTFLLTVLPMTMHAGEKLDLKDIAGGKFSPEYLSGINPVEGTGQYLTVSDDDRQIVRHDYAGGGDGEVIFDTGRHSSDSIAKIDAYLLSPDGRWLLVRHKTRKIYRHSYLADFLLADLKTGQTARLGSNIQMAAWAPDSRRIAYVKDNNIFVTSTDDVTQARQLTQDGEDGKVLNGVPDWVNEEEFATNRSFVFSPDSRYLVWVRYDESAVRTMVLPFYNGEDGKNYPEPYAYKYPKAGEDNAKVSLWCADLTSDETRPLPLPLDKDGYIPRVKCLKEGGDVLVMTLNRHQDDLRLYRVTPASGACRMIVEEKSDKYVKEEVLDNIRTGSGTLLLPSDRDGFMHLYLYTLDGQLVRQVEKGEYDVTGVYGYDEALGRVYYQAAMLGAHDRQVYVTDRKGKTRRLTDRQGWNNAAFSGDFKYFINCWSDYNHPFVYTVRRQDGQVVSTPVDNRQLTERLIPYRLTAREPFSFTTSEGVRLDGWMVRPADFDASRKYPVIMYQYGGPGNQQVIDCWSAGSMGNGGLYDHYLAQQGFIIVCVDGRGTGGRGAGFEKCTYMRLGDLESKDQVETARYLAALPYVDKERIGIWGWSYGGFNTLMSMSEGRKVFRAGVAVAPPTDWRFYDTIYTERYMRTPAENKAGYDDNPIRRADRLGGSLLICHGTGDDNVHPQHSYEYAKALVEADKDFREIYYTNCNHSIRVGNARYHLLRQIADFFVQTLK